MDREPASPDESPDVSVGDALAFAVGLHRNGALKDAESIYRAVLGACPGHPDALHFLGVLSHQLGREAEAVEMIRRALEIVPGNPGMHNNLGNVLQEQGRFQEAEAAYRAVIALVPDDADAHNNLGVVMKEQRKYEEALSHYRRAIEIRPGHAEAHLNLGNVLRRLGRLDEAVAACRRAIELKPDQSVAYEILATSLLRESRPTEALDVVRQWLAFEPAHPIARHMAASLGGVPAPDRAPDEYVRALFDRFAGSFDERLEGLGYRAPELVARAVAGRYRAEASLRVLDAGCGTGLCGPLLAPYAARLVGVDLSGPMLDKAGGRGVYHELAQAELTAFLEARPGEFDLIVSADTLVYFGDLTRALRAAAGALHPMGALVFTVERWKGAKRGVRLNEHGRYSHSAPYLRGALAEAGFSVEAMATETLRSEAGKPVGGFVITARRGGGEVRNP